MKSRRSIRKYKNTPIEIHNILKEALNTPSSCNRKPWKLIVVDDLSLKTELAMCRGKQNQMILQAPLSVIVIADTSAYQNDNVWIEDCAALTMNIHLNCHFHNLGSCWIQIRDRKYDENTSASQYIKKLFNLEAYQEVAAVITIGIPDEQKEANVINTKIVQHNLNGDYFK